MVWHLSLPLMNIFNKTKSFPMLPGCFPFLSSNCKNRVPTPNINWRICVLLYDIYHYFWGLVLVWQLYSVTPTSLCSYIPGMHVVNVLKLELYSCHKMRHWWVKYWMYWCCVDMLIPTQVQSWSPADHKNHVK